MSFTIHYGTQPLKFLPTGKGVWVCVISNFQADLIRNNAVDADLLTQPIEYLELPIRPQRCLQQAGIFTIMSLLSQREDDLLRLPTFGKRSLKEVVSALALQGLTLRSN